MSHILPALDLSALDKALTYPLGRFRRVDVVAQTGSTNSDISAQAASQPALWPDLSVLIADSQIAGKGRLERVWEVPAGTAMISSVLLRPTDPAVSLGAPNFLPTGYGWLSVLAGIALCQAIAAESGVAPTLKWPNDVLLNGRKLAGILAQLVTAPAEGSVAEASSVGTERNLKRDGGRMGPGVVVGAGVNISQQRDQLPVDRATSLTLEGGTELDRNVLLPAYLNRFAQLYEEFVAVGGDALHPLRSGESIHAMASALMETLGTAVRAELPGGALIYGTARSLAADGSLEIEAADGNLHRVSAGDVVHVRRTDQGGLSYA